MIKRVKERFSQGRLFSESILSILKKSNWAKSDGSDSLFWQKKGENLSKTYEKSLKSRANHWCRSFLKEIESDLHTFALFKEQQDRFVHDSSDSLEKKNVIFVYFWQFSPSFYAKRANCSRRSSLSPSFLKIDGTDSLSSPSLQKSNFERIAHSRSFLKIGESKTAKSERSKGRPTVYLWSELIGWR